MAIRRISPFSHRFSRLGLVHAYLVRESDSYTLIDTTIRGSGKGLLKAAREIAGDLRVGRILLTHAHVDHIGSLDELARSLEGVEVAISQREARLLAKPPAQDLSTDPGEATGPIKGGLPGAATAPTHFVQQGELYGSLRCLATPGHTPGHFSFFDERDGTLYAGDALVTVGGKVHITGWSPWYFPFPNMATWDKPTAIASARMLAELPVSRIAPGHGRVVEGCAALNAALREASSLQ